MRQQVYIQQHFRRGNAESSVNQDEKRPPHLTCFVVPVKARPTFMWATQ